jgi:Ca2+-binding RTX toxin-like protein
MLLEGTDLHVFAASQASHGLAQLTIDVSAQGLVLQAGSGQLNGQGHDDMLVGGASDNALFGNGGDDILIDGYGTDELTGGAGADTFVFGADGQSDSIRDFEYGVDRIDLSAVPMLYGPSQLSVGSHNWGARLMLPGVDALQGGSGDDTLRGGEGNDTLLGGDGADLLEG